jgi:beta-glucosidase
MTGDSTHPGRASGSGRGGRIERSSEERGPREAWAEAHLGDRTALDLPGPQDELVRRVLETGTPTVVVLQNGRPPAIPGIAGSVPAILEIWYGGQEAGTAVAEALFGDLNPGGKLPVTLPRSAHGLSYTTFRHGEPTVTPDALAAARDAAVEVAVDVANTGDRTGHEVVQLYIRNLLSNVTRPVRELRGFERVTLAPGEARTVSFRLGPDDLACTGLDMERVVEPGEFESCTGASSASLQCASLTVR